MHFMDFMGFPVTVKTILLKVINANFITLFRLQTDTEELCETDEHKNAKTILETTVLEEQDFDYRLCNLGNILSDYSEC